ncbi:hypothetical protein, partial [Candidatus Frankia alpina]|uniref:hypothetical protein n=1 Tax=Candidatus Frankia alpina TaxID=2699483 RepID=UPI00196890C0
HTNTTLMSRKATKRYRERLSVRLIESMRPHAAVVLELACHQAAWQPIANWRTLDTQNHYNGTPFSHLTSADAPLRHPVDVP